MLDEVNFLGIYFSGALVVAGVAWLVLMIVRRLLRWVGFYRLIWHPALVDIALFGILWCLSAWAMPILARMLA
jgi:protein AaeX